MEEHDQSCPVCGLKMTMLSPQSWSCKCGHVEKRRTPREGKTTTEEETVDEERDFRIRFWEKMKKDYFHPPKDRVPDKRKRTSTGG